MSDSQVLERFHRALLEEIQTQRPEYLTGAFTIAEIYQNLVPYGTHRDRIGVDMNADYEDALLRLLAGEGDFLLLDSEPALRDIRAELDTSNPNTGLYREFAAVDVRLNPSRIDLSASAIDEVSDLASALEPEPTTTLADLAPTDASDESIGVVPPGADIFDNGSEPTGSQAGSDDPPPPAGGLFPEFVEPSHGEPTEAPPAPVSGTSCPWCRAGLPERENLNFCPFCGTDLSLLPCAACGEQLEPAWSFCAKCGAGVGA